MYVIKRSGEPAQVHFDEITERISKLCYGLNEQFVDPGTVALSVINGMYAGITTAELDELTAQTCAYMAVTHPDFSKLAARVSVSNLHKTTHDKFSDVAEVLHKYSDSQGRDCKLLSDDVYEFVQENKKILDDAIDYSRDFDYDFFGFKTLERGYLLKVNDQIAERPQQMLMRVAAGIHTGDLSSCLECYELMSRKLYTHATPTLFNAGTTKPQMSSCFLLSMEEDSIDGIFNTLKRCAQISQHAGGIGLSVHGIRATDSYIRGTNGKSNGLVPMLRVFNDTARYVDQGGGKRKGSFAVYLEPWHADVFEFLELKKNQGKEEKRARDLFYALWIPDLFMERVESDGPWTLMCPNECPGLNEKWGDEFKELYETYEREARGRKTVKAQELWRVICSSQVETGTPYMLYKDSCNRKSNQQNLGCIQSSNLCTEIVEFTSKDEVAVCNLASLALSQYAKENGKFDYQHLHDVTKVATRSLNRVIDRNYYPVPEARNSNMRHRPIALGVQGFADALMIMRLPYESPEAARFNKNVFETIYHAACEASCDLARESGPYSTFHGSPASQGKLQFDLWNVTPDSGLWDWDALKENIKLYGMRNSLLVAPMPTASTSQILSNNESFEPYTSNIYCRRVLSGEFFVVNPHLLRDLVDRNLWNDELKQLLLAHNGSVQHIPGIPAELKELYKTVWEIKQKSVLDMAADRGPYIDQSQSLNIHMGQPTLSKLSSMHFYGWKRGLKTGVYYLRTQAAADAIKFTVEKSALSHAKEATENPRAPGTPEPVSKILAPKTFSPAHKVVLSPLRSLRRDKENIPTPIRGAGKQPDPEATPLPPPPAARICPLRPRGLPQDQVCDMCSG